MGELCTSIGNIEFPHYMKEDPDISIIDEALSEDNVRDYLKNMYASTFAFCASGRNLHLRVLEALKYGNIPVIIDHDIVMPFEDVLDWSLFAIFIPFRDLNGIKAMLRAIPEPKLKQMQALGTYVFETRLADHATVANAVAQL